ncbi:MAG: CHAT domain-containing protein [Bacteroidales bacterium]
MPFVFYVRAFRNVTTWIALLLAAHSLCAAAGVHPDGRVVDSLIRSAQFEEALALIKNSRQAEPDEHKNADLLLQQSQVLLKQGKYNQAGNAISEASNIVASLRNPGHRLQFNLALQKARYAGYIWNQEEYLHWLQHAKSFAKSSGNTKAADFVQLHEEYGAYFLRQKEYRNAATYYEMTLKEQDAATWNGKVNANLLRIRLAEIYRHIDKKLAGQYIESALSFQELNKRMQHPAFTENYLYAVEYLLSTHDDADKIKALLGKVSLLIADHYTADHFLNGILYYLKGKSEYNERDYENAFLFSKQAENIASRNPVLKEYRVSNLYLIANNYYFYYKKDFAQSIAYYALALDNMKGIRKPPLSNIYQGIGLAWLQLDNRDNAKKYLLKSLDASRFPETVNDSITRSNAYLKMAGIELREDNYVLARVYHKKAIESLPKYNQYRKQKQVTYHETGRTYARYHETMKALHAYQQAITVSCRNFSDTSFFANPSISDVLLNDKQLIECLTNKAYAIYQLYEKNAQKSEYLNASLDCQELAVQLMDYQAVGIDEENSGLDFYTRNPRVVNNAVSYATLLYLKTGERYYAEKAFGYSEKSKMQLLTAKSKRRDILVQAGVPDSLISKEERIVNEILDIENRIHLDAGDLSGNISDDRLLIRLNRLYALRDEHAGMINRKYHASHLLQFEMVPDGISRAQQMLDEEQVMLEFQLLRTEIITFVIKKHDFHIHFQFIDKDVPAKIFQLRNVISSNPMLASYDSSYNSFVEASSFLYGKLIRPVYDQIKGKRLIIIPHNDLTLFPFEILIPGVPAPGAGPGYKSLQYLIREFPVTYAFSANLLQDKQNKRKKSKGAGIFLPDYSPYGNKSMQEQLPELKGAASEAALIRKITHGRLFDGALANETSFKSKAGRFRILHIAAHSFLDGRNPLLSYLVMSAPDDTVDDGKLHAFEIMQMKLNAQLVVLSGCNTGFGVLRKNEGLISLTRSFLYTGVRTVAYTLWPVADASGAKITGSMYEKLRQYNRLDDALRDSKLEFIENADPVTAHPFYWSGYVVAGKADQLVIRKYPWLVISLTSLITLLTGFLLYKRFRNRAS